MKVDLVCVDNPTATKFTIRILAVAEAERDMIATRMREAFAAARRAGERIGNPDLGRNNRKAAVESGMPSHRSTQGVADELNSRGTATAGGRQWHAVRVHRARRHLGL